MGLARAARQIYRLWRIPASGASRRLMWQLAANRYHYPGLSKLARMFGLRESEELAAVELWVHGRRIRVHFDPCDVGDVASIFENFIELPVPEKHLRNIRYAACFGGHIGTFALALLARNPDCKLTVFEPSSRNRTLLAQNLKENGFDAVIRPEAIWTSSGHVQFTKTVSNAGRVVSTRERDEQEVTTVASVDVKMLDDVFLRQLDFIEMDIEGAEWEVLPPLLSRVRPGCRIYFEAHDCEMHGRRLHAIETIRPCRSFSLGKVGNHELRCLTVLK